MNRCYPEEYVAALESAADQMHEALDAVKGTMDLKRDALAAHFEAKQLAPKGLKVQKILKNPGHCSIIEAVVSVRTIESALKLVEDYASSPFVTLKPISDTTYAYETEKHIYLVFDENAQ